MCQATLASRLGVSQPAVSRLERNLNRMMVATLRAVVQASNDQWQIPSRPEKLFSLGNKPPAPPSPVPRRPSKQCVPEQHAVLITWRDEPHQTGLRVRFHAEGRIRL